MNYFIIIEDHYNKSLHTFSVNQLTAPIKIVRATSPNQKTEDLNPSVIYINQNVLRVGREHAYIGFDKEENNWYVENSFLTQAPTFVRNYQWIEKYVEDKETVSNTDQILLGINKEISIKIQNDETQAIETYLENNLSEETTSTKNLPDWFDHENPSINGEKLKFSKKMKLVFDELLILYMSEGGKSKRIDSNDLTMSIKKRNNESTSFDVSPSKIDQDATYNRNLIAQMRRYFKKLYIEDPNNLKSGKLKDSNVFLCIENHNQAGYYLNFDHNDCEHKDEGWLLFN